MLRSVIILALLASLFYLVKHIQPVAEPGGPGRVATIRPEPPPVAEVPGDDSSRFNPPVVTPLPDINKGYIFSEKREFVKAAPLEAGKASHVEQGPDPLTSVVYSGSVVVGDFRRALVSYQEQPRETVPRRTSQGRGPVLGAVQSGVRNKQLHQGDSFLGYVVAAIEADRIVFKKGDLKVEKFLHDRNKKRLAAPEPSRQEASRQEASQQEASRQEAASAEMGRVPIQAMVPPEILEALMAQPSAMRTTPGAGLSEPTQGTGLNGLNSGATPAGETGGARTPAPASRVLRRSQRLLGIDPSIAVPVTPVPGRPVPNK